MSATGGDGWASVSVVVPCMGAAAVVRRCLASVLRHSRRPWELIAVTRGGDEPVASYLAGVRDAAGIPVQLVTDPDLKGPRAAWARGLRQARGDHVALVGPTVVVTDGWLDQLVALANADPAIGMVAPPRARARRPGWSAGLRGPEDARGPGGVCGEVEGAARKRAEWSEEGSLAGHCLLLKREALDALGGGRRMRAQGLRPDRLSRRIRAGGYKLALAYDLYVHQDVPHPRTAPAIDPPAPAGPAGSASRSRRVSLTMIVRDEEDNLPACLRSAEGLFDEIVVVDTGSTDRTRGDRSLVRRERHELPLGRRLRGRPQCGGSERARGDYAFWLDADDRIEPDQLAKKFLALLDGLGTEEAAYVVRCALRS